MLSVLKVIRTSYWVVDFEFYRGTTLLVISLKNSSSLNSLSKYLDLDVYIEYTLTIIGKASDMIIMYRLDLLCKLATDVQSRPTDLFQKLVVCFLLGSVIDRLERRIDEPKWGSFCQKYLATRRCVS